MSNPSVNRCSQRDGAKYLKVITSSGTAVISDKNSSGAKFADLAREMSALAPNDLRAPAETHPFMLPLCVAGALLAVIPYICLISQDRVVVWANRLGDALGSRPAVNLAMIAAGIGPIILGVASVFRAIRLAHRWFGVKLALPLGLAFFGVIASVFLRISVVSVVGVFLVGLTAGVVMERRKSLKQPRNLAPRSPFGVESQG